MTSKYPPRSGGRRAVACRECGALAVDGASISARDLCLDCSHDRASSAAEQVAARSGPYYDQYRQGMIEYARRLAATS